MNTARIVLVLALFAAFVVSALSQDEPTVMLFGLAVPVWIAIEGCWRILEPRR